MATNSAKYLSTLHKQIDKYFSISEVRTLCFNLGVDHENIPGDHRSAFVRNLIVSLAKKGRLQELVDEVKAERTFLDWPDVPADFELPSSIAEESIQKVVNYHVYGDYVGGDKIAGDKVSGDKISVGNIENAEGIAIGRDSSANVNKGEAPAERPSPTQPTPPIANLTVQQSVDQLKGYLTIAALKQQETADELTNGMHLILKWVNEHPEDTLHLKLLCLGQQKLAQEIGSDVPGIDEVVAQFVTAVQQKS